MKNTTKILLFSVLVLSILLILPNISNASVEQVNSETELVNAISNAKEGDTIQLTQSITLENTALEIYTKNLTIDGNGNSLIGTSGIQGASSSNNKSIITAMAGSKVDLTNIILEDSPKYGVQAHDGGYISLTNVTIRNCSYGGILVNAGTVEIINLSLGKNGSSSNNGIEISKSINLASSSNQPTLIMNGTLSSTESENVIYLASDSNDGTSEFILQNTSTSSNKILADGNKIVVTDRNNNVVYTSNENNNVTINGDNYEATYKVTVYLMDTDKTVSIDVAEGTILTSDSLASKINLESLGLSNYTLNGFYTDSNYTTEFDFTQAINSNTSIYAKLTSNEGSSEQEASSEQVSGEKDETPKTGIANHLGIATIILAISVVALTTLKRKNK